MSKELKERYTEKAKRWKRITKVRITKRHAESACISVSSVKSKSSTGTTVEREHSRKE